MDKVKNFFLKEARPFVEKREIDWGKVKLVLGAGLGVLLVVILLTPAQDMTIAETDAENSAFNEQVNVGEHSMNETPAAVSEEMLSYKETTAKPRARGPRSTPPKLMFESESAGMGSKDEGSSNKNYNTPMIIARAGSSAKHKLSPGFRIPVVILEGVSVGEETVPIAGIVSKDVVHEDDLAIPKNSKLLGDVSFDDEAGRGKISWHTLLLPSGEERPLSAVGIGADGHVGIFGKVKGDGWKNTAGQLITRFVGAYAEGNMEKGQNGAAPGGYKNGLRNAVSETGKEQAESFGDDLKKERRWIEIDGGTATIALVNKAYVFRDPGFVHGQ